MSVARLFLTSFFILGAFGELIPRTAAATSWPAPRRPLTSDERLDMAASASDAVGAGTILSLGDSLDGEGIRLRWMVLRPQRWFKGALGNAVVRVYFPTISNLGINQVSKWIAGKPVDCIVFIRQVRSAAGDYWVLAEHPDHAGYGILRLLDSNRATQESAARAAIDRLTPVALTRRSQLVVVGNVRSRVRRRIQGRTVVATRVLVDSVLAGSSPGDTLLVHYGPYGLLGTDGQMVLMLRRESNGTYEVVGFESGMFHIRDGCVVTSGEALPAFSTRIRQAARARTEGTAP